MSNNMGRVIIPSGMDRIGKKSIESMMAADERKRKMLAYLKGLPKTAARVPGTSYAKAATRRSKSPRGKKSRKANRRN